jgi:hypothetical protein
VPAAWPPTRPSANVCTTAPRTTPGTAPRADPAAALFPLSTSHAPLPDRRRAPAGARRRARRARRRAAHQAGRPHHHDHHRAPGTERGAFVVTLGADTVSAERFTRTASRLEGDVFQRAPMPRVTHYTIALDGQGRPTRSEVRTRRPDGTPMPGNAPLGSVVTFRADSAFAEVQRADSTSRFAAAAPAGTLPSVGGSWAIYELVTAGLRAAGRDSGDVMLWGPGAPKPQALALSVRGNQARLDYFGDPMAMRLDARGRILAVDGSRTTNKVLATRVADVDVAGMARTFAARPAMGPTSPADSVSGAVGAAQVAVVYSRPSARGRTVWGGTLVPYGAIWRTGANAATTLRTSADLVVGGTRVPAGTYTLFTMPGAGASQLVISKQTGQWGTEYKPDQDLARVPLTATALPAPVEQFTIAVEPAAAGGANLVMRWGDRQLSAPVQAAPQGTPQARRRRRFVRPAGRPSGALDRPRSPARRAP